MRLIVIRHAIAVPRGTPGYPDAERPLTDRGIRRFRSAAGGLARLLSPPRAILTSPWLRARQTAEIAAEAWGGPSPVDAPCLAEWSLDGLQEALDRFEPGDAVAVVGHEPDLSFLVTMLMGSERSERLVFKKGGAALVDLPGPLREGGTLLWHLPPRILTRIDGA